jgi:single-strand DNA-binding protein
MAADINSVVLVGRLTRDAELKYTNSGFPISKLGLAVNRKRKKEGQWIEEANFFDILLWGKIAEALQPYLVKGKLIGVHGELSQNRWEQDGQTRSKVEIVANNIQLLGGRVGTQGPGTQNRNTYSAPEENTYAPTGTQGTSTMDNFEDDIPF